MIPKVMLQIYVDKNKVKENLRSLIYTGFILNIKKGFTGVETLSLMTSKKTR